MGGAQAPHQQQAGDAAAPGHVRLQAVDAPAGDQVAEVRQDVAVLPGGDVQASRPPVAQQAQAVEVVGAHGFLEPPHVPPVTEPLGPRQRLFAGQRPIGVAEQPRLVADGLADGVEAGRVLLGPARRLDLHPRDALRHPSTGLVGQALQGVVAEAAAAVHRDPVVGGAHQVHHRDTEQLGVEVPERDVDRRHRHHPRTGPPGVAEGHPHGVPGAGAAAHVGARDHRRQRPGRGGPPPSPRRCSRCRCSHRPPARRPPWSSSPTPSCRPTRDRRSGSCRPRRRPSALVPSLDACPAPPAPNRAGPATGGPGDSGARRSGLT